MVRTIVTPKDTDLHLTLDKEYVGKPKVTYLSLEELVPKPSLKTMGDFWGILSDETAEILRENVKQMRGEWDRDI
jgi:hypothetical protein